MAGPILLSRFENFIARATVAAYNAKVDLFNTLQASGLPLPTGDFVLTLSGTLVDDVGGVGVNEIERITRTVAPETVQSTRTTEPEEISTTIADPETSENVDIGSETVAEANAQSENSDEKSDQNSTEAGSETGTENADETTRQVFGRRVQTENYAY